MNISKQMKAMALNEFGGADKLTLHTLPVPRVDAGEVLIRVEVAGVGVWDALDREGKLPFQEVQFPHVVGGECAGTVAAVGESSRFAVGDRVYAHSFMNPKGGSYAQYVAVSQSGVAPIPDGLEPLMAGGLAISGLTALSNLHAAKVGEGTRLMLWGASGGVGHVALQLAKRLSARVFAVASGADGVELCQELGADEAVDGHSEGIESRARAFAPDGFDAAFVLVSGEGVQSSLELVRRGGIITFPNGVPEPKAPDGVQVVKANANPELLGELNRLIGEGEFRVHIAQTFALEDAAQAQEAMKKHTIGKIVLRVSGESSL